MVYKKYTYKRGKKFGPYYYESKRVDGKIVTTYLGTNLPKKNNKLFYSSLTLFSLIFIAIAIYFVSFNLTGNVSLDIKTKYDFGEGIKGELNLNLLEGELLPADSVVLVSYGNFSKEFVLSDLISEDFSEGNFYTKGVSLSGDGKGYGVLGKIKEYPYVDFKLNLIENSGGSSESVNGDEKGSVDSGNLQSGDKSSDKISGSEIVVGTGETQNGKSSSSDTKVNEQKQLESNSGKSEVKNDKSVDSKSDKGSSITGSVVSESSNVISGKTSKDNPFTYSFSNGRTASLVEGSVYYNNSVIGDDSVKVKSGKTEVTVSTNYFVEKEGFGEEYIGKMGKKISIDIEPFGVVADSESVFIVSISYGGQKIVEASKEITIANKEKGSEIGNGEGEGSGSEIVVGSNDSLGNGTIVLGNESVKNITEVNQTELVNVTQLNRTLINESLVSVNTSQFKAVLGQPVRWVKKVSLENVNESLSLIVEIPLSADNITVSKIRSETFVEQNTNLIEQNTSSSNVSVIENIIPSDNLEVVKEVVLDTNVPENSSPDLTVGITGQVTADLKLKKSGTEGFFSKILKLFGITGRVVDESENLEVQEIYVEIDKADTGVEVEYYTDAPVASEEIVSENFKKVFVSSPDDVHYEDVLIFTNLSDSLKLTKTSSVRIEWVENNSLLDVYSVNDSNGDGYYDYVEWIAPSLSNQTFNIIVIVNAEHLDENRTFVSDIFDSVRELDGNWSETIPDGHYVRVRFERNLTSDRDISIYPRIVSGTPVVNVYEVNSDVLIEQFNNIVENSYNKIYLTNLSNGQCYDNQTEILTENGWKYFYDLGDERVATLNQETKEIEWEIPIEKQEFEHDGKMYKISLDEAKKSLGEFHISSFKNNLSNSSVVYTGTNDCAFRCGSFDQIAAFLERANARKSISFGSGINSNDFSRKSSYSEELKNSINSSASVCLISNSCSESLDFCKHSSLYLFNSNFINFGAKNLDLIDENKYEEVEFGFAIANKTLLSNTSFIVIPYSDNISLLLSEDSLLNNSSLFLGERLESNLLNLPFFAFLPSSTDHLIKSCSSSDLNLLSNICFNTSLLTKVTSNSDKSILDSSACFFNSSGTFTLNSIMEKGVDSNYINISARKIPEANRNFLAPQPQNSMNSDELFVSPEHKVYAKINDEGFKLMSIKDVYRLIENNKIYFLDANGLERKIDSIIIENYSGKIYDVDVSNDVVLVKRGESGSAFWSGNSNDYSQDTFDLRVLGGSLEFDHIIDPIENITNFTADGQYTVPAGVTTITVRAWAGGGGGGGSSSNNNGGSGGAGGQYSERNISVTGGQIFNVTIGAGGAGGAAGNNPGAVGKNTTFLNNTQNYVRAIGGTGGAGNKGAPGLGNLTGGIGTTIIRFGGNGSTGTTEGGGGGGGAGTTANGTSATSSTGGAGGSLFGGNGGDGVVDGDGLPGNNYSAGGGGGERAGGTNKAGGNGAQGFLQVVFLQADTTPPVVNLIAPANGSTIGATRSFNATFSEDVTLKNATFRLWNSSLNLINETNRTISGTSDSVNLTVTLPYNGTFTWNYRACNVDDLCVANATNFTVFSDQIAPQVTIIRPENITYTSLPIPFNISTNENSSFANYTLNNGVTNYTMQNNGNRDFNATNNSIAVGGYIVRFFVWDIYGNLNSTVNRTFSVVEDTSISACSNLTIAGTTYNQTQNIVPNNAAQPCITISANNVTFNGAGYWIANTTFNNTGIYATGRRNVTIQNVNVSLNRTNAGNNNALGVYFVGTNNSLIKDSIFSFNKNGVYLNTKSSNNTLNNLTANSNSLYGVYLLSSSDNNTLSSVTANSNSLYGIILFTSSNNQFTNVTANSNSLDGIILFTSSNNNLSSVTANNNSNNGIFIWTSSNNNLSSVTANNNSNNGIYLLSSSDNNQINNVTANSNSLDGIFLSTSSNNNQINNVTANSNSLGGIYLLSSSDNNQINNVTANSNSLDGIFLSTSSNNNLSSVTANNNSNNGIYLLGSSNNNLSSVTANSNSQYGIRLGSGSNNNQLINGLVNASRRNAIYILSNSLNNNFNNLTISNTNSSFYDLNVSVSSDGTRLINMPHIGNYSFEGVGATLIVNDSSFGQIRFLQPVNGSGTNLTADVRILSNNATVRSNVNQGLNRSANVTLYGLPVLSSPYIARDGVACTDCYNFTSLNAGTVVFNVSSWTEYSIASNLGVSACSNLTTAGTTFTQTQNIVPNNAAQPCITISANNVTFNGAGYWIANTTFNNSGIYATGRRNVTIQNVNVSLNRTNAGNNNAFGVYFVATNNSVIKDSIFSFNRFGVYLDTQSSNNTIQNVTANSNSDDGIYLYSSSNNNISSVTANNNNYGISLSSSSNNNILTSVTANSNSLDGISLSSSSNNNISSVTANSNLNHGISLFSSSNNQFTNLTANSNSNTGIYLQSSSNNNLSSVTANNNNYGIDLYSSPNNTFTNGLINSSLSDAVYLNYDNYATEPMRDNRFTNITITNTNSSRYDLYVDFWADEAGSYYINNTHFIDTYIGNYTIRNTTADVQDYGIHLIMEDTRFGEVRFLQPVNGSGTNLSADVRILNNSATVRSNVNQGLNRSANVTLYGLSTSFSGPIILRDGVACTDCYNFTSLNAGTVVFNVSSWTEYSVGESSDIIAPVINFTSPTPANGTTQSGNSIFVNVSASDANNISSFIDFDNSLVSWWRMDDLNSSGGVVDYMGRNNGTAFGNAVQNVSGKMGKSFTFDGSGDYIGVKTFELSNRSYTISAWVKTTTSPLAEQVYFSAFSAYNNGQNMHLRVLWDGSVTMGLWSDDLTTSTGHIEFGNWSHIGITYDNSTDNSTVYINGIPRGSNNAGPFLGVNPTIEIGDWAGGGNQDFNGSIDDVLVFNRSLSVTEVLALYANSSTKYYSNNFTNLADKTYNFKAYAQDTFGNVNSTETRSVTVDITPPRVTINQPKSADLMPPILFNVTTNEASSFANYTLNNGVTNYTMQNNGNRDFNATNNSIAVGGYIVRFFVWDIYGNLNSTVNRTFSVVNPFRARTCVAMSSSSEENTYGSSCAGTYLSSCPSDLISCEDGLVEQENLDLNTYAGIKITSFNSSVTDCKSITSVTLCYNWYTDFTDFSGSCDIYVDADGENSYTSLGGVCPSVGSSLTTCEDVTSLETWRCSNFFGSNGTRAIARTEVLNQIEAVSNILSHDVLLFEVNYNIVNTTAPVINFTNPTPANGTTQSGNSIFVNVSASDANNISSFIDFDNSLVSWFRMDDLNSSGGVVDYMGRNNGTVYGDAFQTDAGKFGRAFSFDGNGDYLNITNSSSSFDINNGSFFAWIKTSNAGNGYRGIVVKSLAYGMFLVDNNFSMYDWGTSTNRDTKVNLADNNWHLIGATFQSGVANGTKLYIDGLLNLTTNITVSSQNVGLVIGNNPGVSQFFNGVIDDVMIFNRTLSASEVMALYANSSTKYYFNSFANLNDGTHTFKAYAQDTDGNVNSTEQRSVTVDTSLIGSCGTLSSAGTTYTQTQNIVPSDASSPCITVGADNVTFNGAGYSIFNTTFNNTGIYATGRLNVTVQNVNVSLNGTNAGNNNAFGIYFVATNNSLIKDSIFGFNKYGVYLNTGSSNNTIQNITSSNNGLDGAYIQTSSNNNQLSSITANSNSQGGISISLSNSSQISNVTVNNNEIYGVSLSSSSNNSLTSVTANSNSNYGIYMGPFSNNNQLSNVTANNNNDDSISLYSSSNTFSNVTIFTSSDTLSDGTIYLGSATNNTFNNLVIQKAPSVGINLVGSSSDNVLINSVVNGTGASGIRFSSGADNNEFRSVNITNINASFYDLQFFDASVNGTKLINIPHIGNYSFAGVGGTLIVNDSSFGQIRFLNPVNGSGTNLTADVRILNNSATVRSDVNVGLNRTANVTLTGLSTSFTNPQIFRDGVLCSAPNCNNFTSLNAGTVVFNVSSWTNYSIGEGPDIIAPVINFTSPTPANGTTQSGNSIFVNVSASDANNISSFIDFDNSLVSWWRMDDLNASGDVVDYMGRNNASKKGNAVQNDSGIIGKSFSFDGGSGYVDVGNVDINIGNSFAIGSWIKARQRREQFHAILSKGIKNTGHYEIYIDSSTGKFSFYSNDISGPSTGSKVVDDDIWHHVMATYNSTNLILYVDGIVEDNFIASGTVTAETENFNIARQVDGGGTMYFNGSIDDVIIFNRTLSASEVRALYANTSSKYYSNNFTNLADGTHNFKAYAQDTAGNVNSTETRSVGVDVTLPAISFVDPTPLSGTQETNSIFVNVSSSDYHQHEAFVDFNNDLLLWMRMDDVNSTGHPTDLSSHSNNGTLFGNTLINKTGYWGNASHFDGIDDSINLSKTAFNVSRSNFTLSAWVNPKSLGTNMIFCKGAVNTEFLLFGGSTGTITWRVFNITGTQTDISSGAGVLAVNTWDHVVAVRNDTGTTLYNNGNFVTSSVLAPGGTKILGTNLHLGSCDGTGFEWNGTMDEVLMFNRSLTATEISALYNASTTQYFRNFTNLADGSYNFVAHAQDIFANKNSTETRIVTIDTSLVSTCTTLGVAGTTYTQSANIVPSNASVPCITVGADNVTFNGAGYSIFNLTFNNSGIYATGRLNVTVQNVNVSLNRTNSVRNNAFGVYFIGTNNSLIKDSLFDSNKMGVSLLTRSINNLITNITANNNSQYGLYLETSSNNNLSLITSNYNSFYGIYLFSSANDNAISNVTTNNNSVTGVRLHTSSNRNLLHNLTSNHNSQYGIDIISSSSDNNLSIITTNRNLLSGIILQTSANNNIISSVTSLNNSGSGIRLASNNNIVYNVTSNGNSNGILLSTPSKNNIVSNITSNNNLDSGVRLSGSSNNTLSIINSNGNSLSGVYISASNNNTLSSAVLNDNLNSSIFLYTSESSNNNLSNFIINNSLRDAIYIYQDTNLVFTENNRFINISVSNTNLSRYDLNVEFADVFEEEIYVNSAYFIDTFLTNYSIKNATSDIYVYGIHLIMEDTRFGEVRFLQPVNGSGTNLTADVRILNNSATVRSNVNQGLNRSANVTLYGLSTSFTNPVILRDGVACPVGVCYNFTSLNAGTVVFNVSSWTNYSIGEGASANNAPYNGTALIMNSTLGLNRTLENLNVRTTLLDLDNNTMNVTVRWYNNSILYKAFEYNSSYANGTTFIATLGFGNTTKGQNWSAGFTIHDGAVGFNVNSSNLTILNSPPNVTLISPTNNSVTLDRTNQIFDWVSSDDDGDSLSDWQINISLVASSSCVDNNYNGATLRTSGITNGFDLSADGVGPLNCLSDFGDYYLWTARSSHGGVYSAFPAPRILNVQAYINVVMNLSAVSFGNLGYLKSNDTTDNSPQPIIIINEGNVLNNIQVQASNLWRSVNNPTSNYQFKFDNVSTNGIFENNTFKIAGTVISYTAIDTIPTNALVDLNYTDIADSVEVDFNVTVPASESSGFRNSTITFTFSIGTGDSY